MLAIALGVDAAALGAAEPPLGAGCGAVARAVPSKAGVACRRTGAVAVSAMVRVGPDIDAAPAAARRGWLTLGSTTSIAVGFDVTVSNHRVGICITVGVRSPVILHDLGAAGQEQAAGNEFEPFHLDVINDRLLVLEGQVDVRDEIDLGRE